MSRRTVPGGPVEIIQVLALIPQTARKAIRIARVRQRGVEVIELRLCGLDPGWEASVGDHRMTVRGSAVGRVIAALQAAQAASGGGKP